MPRTGLEPARLSALAPETSASTIPPPGPVCLPLREPAEYPLIRLQGLFERLSGAKLRLFSERCKFFKRFLQYFGEFSQKQWARTAKMRGMGRSVPYPASGYTH